MSTIVAAEPEIARASPSARETRSLGIDLSSVGGAALFSQALGVVTSLALRTVLDPAAMGIWQGLKLLLSYSNYANLGVSKGAARDLARANGLGKLGIAEQSVRQAFSINLLASAAVSAVLLMAAAFVAAWGTGPYRNAWAGGLAAMGLLVMLQRHVTYQVTLLRATQRIRVTSRLSVLEAMLTLGGAVSAAAWFGLPGLYLATAAILVASWAYLRPHSPVRLGWVWDRVESLRLLQVGGPMLAAGALSSLFRSLDKLMILGMFADREYQLGCYSLSLLVTTQLFGTANLVATVLGPRYAADFGRNAQPGPIAKQVVEATCAMALPLAIVATGAMLLAGPLLGAWLPGYRDGLPALIWLLPGCVALALTLPITQFQMAVGDERRALGVIAVSTGAAIALDLAALSYSASLVSLAIATSVGYGVFWAASFAVSLWPRLALAERRRYRLAMTTAVIPPLMAAALLKVWSVP